MKRKLFQFVTDTAAFAIFDLACLRHRLSDNADWWTIPWVAAEEINKGNCAIFDLRSDGTYHGTIAEGDGDSDRLPNEVKIHVPSGRVFLGAAEEVTADKLEPETLRGGLFLPVPPGEYAIVASGNSDNELTIRIRKVLPFAGNQFEGFVPVNEID